MDSTFGDAANAPFTLRKAMEMFVRNVPMGVAVVDRDLRYIAVSDQWYDVFDLDPQELTGQSFVDHLVGTTQDGRLQFLELALQKGLCEVGREVFYRTRLGRKCWLRCSTYPWHDENGNIGGLVMYRSDITEQTDARRDVEEKRARYEGIYNRTPVMLYSTDGQGKITQASDYWLHKMGYFREEVVGHDASEFMTPASAILFSRRFWPHLLTNEYLIDVPIDWVTGEKTIMHTLLSAAAEHSAEGTPIYADAFMFDVGDLREAERKLALSEQNYRDLYNRSPIMMHSVDSTGRIIRVSDYWLERTGYRKEEVLGRPLADFMEVESAERLRTKVLPEFLATGRLGRATFTLIATDGESIDVLLSGVATRDANGRFLHSNEVMKDVTEIQSSMREAREAYRTFQTFIDHSPAQMYLKSLTGEFILYNRTFSELNHLPPGQRGITSRHLFDAASAEQFEENDRRVVETKLPFRRNLDFSYGGTKLRHLNVIKFPIFDDNGEVKAVGGINIDVTEQRHAEEALLQSQKMDALGKLTGGIAHDFNNILAIILGNLQLMQQHMDLPETEALRLATTINATVHAADLTRQLLMFSRRQKLDPIPIDLNKAIINFNSMISRIIGDTVVVTLELAEDIGTALVDLSQFQSAMLNLAINSRDAMPNGGNIRISTRSVSAAEDSTAKYDGLAKGEYICVALTDDGCGMPSEVRTRAFEPFFTTKSDQTGTGLGLPMVYGFVMQSGGAIALDSEPNAGTEVRLYLPTVTDRAVIADGENSRSRTPVRFKRILVVEDNMAVRSTVSAMIMELGHEPIVAATALDALKIVRSGRQIDLLFTDILMPGGMSGVELATTIRDFFPSVEVLLTSGYQDESIEVPDGMTVLTKPYRIEHLAKLISGRAN